MGRRTIFTGVKAMIGLPGQKFNKLPTEAKIVPNRKIRRTIAAENRCSKIRKKAEKNLTKYRKERRIKNRKLRIDRKRSKRGY